MNVENVKDKTPRGYLSWSQLSLWEQDSELYRRIYIDGLKRHEGEHLRIGKALTQRLETGEEAEDKMIEHIAILLPKYEKKAHEIKADFYGIPVLGKLDCFNRKGLVVGEVKTGRHWSQKMVDKSGQLTFYSMLVWLKYKKLPSNIILHWAETNYDENGDLIITGKIKTFATKRTISDIILLRGRIKKCWKGIIKMYGNK